MKPIPDAWIIWGIWGGNIRRVLLKSLSIFSGWRFVFCVNFCQPVSLWRSQSIFLIIHFAYLLGKQLESCIQTMVAASQGDPDGQASGRCPSLCRDWRTHWWGCHVPHTFLLQLLQQIQHAAATFWVIRDIMTVPNHIVKIQNHESGHKSTWQKTLFSAV